MYPIPTIIRTKLAPPRPQKYTLPRPRLTARLLDARHHRLTLVQAGTGYGKSTAVAALADEKIAIVWYRLEAEDADPQLFLLHLLHGFTSQLPGFSQMPWALLEEWGQNRSALSWTAVTDTLSNEISQHLSHPLFFILDDAHHLHEAGETIRMLDRFIGHAPAHLHIIVASRYPLPLPSLISWRVKGEVLEIGQEELAFTPTEIDALFRHQYGYALSWEQAALLVSQIEGWPIALYLVWQRLQRDGGASLAEALWQLSGSTSDLFTYLTQEVLAQQPADIQDFLRLTAVLRQMTPENCDFLRDGRDSRQILRYLLENGLFVVNLGDGQVRYHHLFHDLLRHQLPQTEAQTLHHKAALYYQQQENTEEAIYHLLAAAAYEEAASLLDDYGRRLVRSGRLDTLAGWVGSLPPDVLAGHPPLLVCLGDIARLHSRFDEALGWYQQAEQRSRTQANNRALGQALRGQARVYLDTVKPVQAEALLQEALRLSDGADDRESRARLLELLAENLLNQGQASAAENYQAQARALRDQGHGTAELPVRLLLRTGRLDEARTTLEALAQTESQSPHLPPRAHRETQLLLSLVYAFQGEFTAALDTAVAGTERGQRLDSQFITSVGYSRQGHAWLLQKDKHGYEQARACFQQAMAISQAIDVPRLQVEPLWGLCQIHGFQGDMSTAHQLAQQAIGLVQADGDEWVEMCIRLTMGAAYGLSRQYEAAADWLAQAVTGFRECSDTYGETVARLWHCLLWQHQADMSRLQRDLGDCLQRVQEHHYTFLFTRRVLLGPPDPRLFVPLLLAARDQQQIPFAEQLLTQMGLAHVRQHPGYQLQVRALGPFQVWRGGLEIPNSDWKRKKARQLFQLLVTHHGRLLHRDQIAELLWPELTAAGALRDFKIAFSAMCDVLEPDRQRHAPSTYVMRDSSRYGLQLEADIWLDVIDVETAVAEGDKLYDHDPARAITHYQRVLDLYHGDFLQAYPYEEWCQEERTRLRALYLRAAERVAQTLSARQQWMTVITVCQGILRTDDCWEPAYQMMMTAYQHMGNRAQALRTYRQCAAALEKGLGVKPASATTQLYHTLTEPP